VEEIVSTSFVLTGGKLESVRLRKRVGGGLCLNPLSDRKSRVKKVCLLISQEPRKKSKNDGERSADGRSSGGESAIPRRERRGSNHNGKGGKNGSLEPLRWEKRRENRERNKWEETKGLASICHISKKPDVIITKELTRRTSRKRNGVPPGC